MVTTAREMTRWARRPFASVASAKREQNAAMVQPAATEPRQLLV